MNRPLISIVLCTYNGEKYLAEQIDSLLNQTYPHFEIIIADDCSTDGTRAVLKQWLGNEKFTIVFNELNLGYARNFEQVARMAKGDFISFCDQDDVWMPHKLQRLYDAINGYSLVFSDSILVDESGRELGKKLSDVRRLQSAFDTRGFAFLNMVSGHTMLVRREVVQAALPIPPKVYHDWWIAAVAASTNGAFYLDEPLTYYRQHRQMVTTNIVTKKELKARSRQRRWEDYEADLAWFAALMRISREDDRSYIHTFYQLYRRKEAGGYVWPLLAHFFKERETVFRYSKKKYLSQLFELRKMARGEKWPRIEGSA